MPAESSYNVESWYVPGCLLEERIAMPKGRVITVECQCGQPLFKYYKGGRGRLIKCFLDEIRKDFVGILDAVEDETRGPGDSALPPCPRCGGKLGIVRIIRGRPALKINQGTVKQVRI
jgi:hypothetical protein